MAVVPKWGTEFGRYFEAVLVWWVKTVGGSIVAVFQIFYALKDKEAPPVITRDLVVPFGGLLYRGRLLGVAKRTHES